MLTSVTLLRQSVFPRTNCAGPLWSHYTFSLNPMCSLHVHTYIHPSSPQSNQPVFTIYLLHSLLSYDFLSALIDVENNNSKTYAYECLTVTHNISTISCRHIYSVPNENKLIFNAQGII